MSAARSYPPPAPPPSVEPRKPGLRSTRSERYEAMLAARDVLRVLVDERRISVRELAECWGCPVSHAAEKLRGDRPIHLGEVYLLPDQLAFAVLAESSAAVRARRSLRAASSSSH